jgi:hypothetical protein
MMFWALILAADMVPGEMGRAAKEPKRRENMAEMLGDLEMKRDPKKRCPCFIE